MANSPPAKKPCPDPEDNVITFCVQNVSKIAGDWTFYSEEKRIGNFPWSILINTSHNNTFLTVHLFNCKNKETNAWFARVNVEFRIINHSNANKTLRSRRTNRTFDWKRAITAGCTSTLWNVSKVLKIEKGFIHNDSLKFEVCVTVLGGHEFRRRDEFGHFSEPTPVSRTLLRIGGRRFYVSKQILAVHSPVLHKYFYSKAQGHDAIEEKFADLDADAFEQLLRMMYRIGEQFDHDTYVEVLELAHLFDMKGVFDEADKALPLMDFDKDEMFDLADKYRLPCLLEHLLRQYTEYSLRPLMESDRYRAFNDSTRARIHERAVELEQQRGKRMKRRCGDDDDDDDEDCVHCYSDSD